MKQFVSSFPLQDKRQVVYCVLDTLTTNPCGLVCKKTAGVETVALSAAP